MNFQLIDIEGIEARDARYIVKALYKNEKSDAHEALARWSQSSRKDFNSVMDCLRMAASYPSTLAHRLRCVSPDKKGRGVYEIAPKRRNARLFYFYAEEDAQYIICMSSYWKTDSKGTKQNQAFDKAAEIRDEYLQWKKRQT